MYDAETAPVPSAPGAECVTVKDGKITYSRTVFDSGPLLAAIQASNSAARPSEPVASTGVGGL